MGRPPILSLRNCITGLVFWAGIWFFSGSIIQIVNTFVGAKFFGLPLSISTCSSCTYGALDGLIETVGIALIGGIAGGFAIFIFWWANNMRPKLLGTIGIFIALAGFVLQLVEPTALYTIPPAGHSDVVLSVAWSPDGKRIASASADKTVQVWDAATGGNVVIYRGHSAPVFNVAWSPDGNLIASSSADGTMQVWFADTGTNLFT